MPRKPRMIDIASMPLTQEELLLANDFARALEQDYGPFTRADAHLVRLAAVEYILSVRLQSRELDTGTILTQMRQNPVATLLRLIESLSATRRQKLLGHKPQEPIVDGNGYQWDANSLKQELLKIGEGT
jgi:hypothetical protein